MQIRSLHRRSRESKIPRLWPNYCRKLLIYINFVSKCRISSNLTHNYNMSVSINLAICSLADVLYLYVSPLLTGPSLSLLPLRS